MRYKIISCILCGKGKKVQYYSPTKTCSNRCRYILTAKHRRRGIFKQCVICHTLKWRRPSEIKTRSSRFCSLKCYWEWRNGKILYKCPICNTKIVDFKSNKRKTCSRKCANKYKSDIFKGRIVTWGKKISLANNRGLTEIKRIIRSSEPYKKWRISVFIRDKYICQFCGVKSGIGCKVYLIVDHIIPFSKIVKEEKVENYEDYINCSRLWDISNGRTLCDNCHRKTDTFAYKAKQYLPLDRT